MGWHRVAETVHDGERLAVHRGPGAGPALVLAHGMEDSWRSWEPFVDGLRGGFTPYALDLPWRPGADYDWLPHTGPAQLLAAAVALVPEPATVLIGHSFGANAVLELLAAGAAPAGAVLIAPYYRPPGDAVSWRLFDRELRRFKVVIGAGLRLRLGDREQTLDPELVDSMVDKALDRVGPLGFVALLRQFLASTELPLHTVAVPTLVVSGGNDPALAGERTTALRAAMPAATVHTQPAGGHFCHVEASAEISAVIGRFLATLHVPATV